MNDLFSRLVARAVGRPAHARPLVPPVFPTRARREPVEDLALDDTPRLPAPSPVLVAAPAVLPHTSTADRVAAAPAPPMPTTETKPPRPLAQKPDAHQPGPAPAQHGRVSPQTPPPRPDAPAPPLERVSRPAPKPRPPASEKSPAPVRPSASFPPDTQRTLAVPQRDLQGDAERRDTLVAAHRERPPVEVVRSVPLPPPVAATRPRRQPDTRHGVAAVDERRTVQITIGRVDVRAQVVTPAPSQADDRRPPAARQRQSLSLSDYLRGDDR